MDVSEANTQSFIVKIWVEEPPAGIDKTSWRGHITHVLSGERFELEGLDDIKAFMDRYLTDEGRSGAFEGQ
jgi:hypothetical protein